MSSRAEVDPAALFKVRHDLSRESPGVIPTMISKDAPEVAFNFRVTTEALMPHLEVGGVESPLKASMEGYVSIFLAMHPGRALSSEFVAQRLINAGIGTTEEKVTEAMKRAAIDCELNRRTGKKVFMLINGTRFAYLDARIKFITNDNKGDDSSAAGGEGGHPGKPGESSAEKKPARVIISRDPERPGFRFVTLTGMDMVAQIDESEQPLLEAMLANPQQDVRGLYNDFREKKNAERIENFKVRLATLGRHLAPIGLGIHVQQVDDTKEICRLVRRRQSPEEEEISASSKSNALISKKQPS